jgi:cytidylate kinase
VREEIADRDSRDRTRSESPLVEPDGAITVDTTDKDPDEVLAILLDHVGARLGRLKP